MQIALRKVRVLVFNLKDKIIYKIIFNPGMFYPDYGVNSEAEYRFSSEIKELEQLYTKFELTSFDLVCKARHEIGGVVTK